MDWSMPGFPAIHSLPEFAQVHIHWVTDAIQPSQPLSPTSPPALNLSQPQGLLQWVGYLHQVDKVLELHLQHQSFQWIFKVVFFQDWLVWSPCSPRDSQESSPAPQFKSINFLALSLLYGPTVPYYITTGNTITLTTRTFISKRMSLLSRFVLAFLPRSRCLLISWQ